MLNMSVWESFSQSSQFSLPSILPSHFHSLQVFQTKNRKTRQNVIAVFTDQSLSCYLATVSSPPGTQIRLSLNSQVSSALEEKQLLAAHNDFLSVKMDLLLITHNILQKEENMWKPRMIVICLQNAICFTILNHNLQN